MIDDEEKEEYDEDDSYSSEVDVIPQLSGEFKEEIPSSPINISHVCVSDSEDEEEIEEILPILAPKNSVYSFQGLNIALLLPFLYNDSLSRILGSSGSSMKSIDDYEEELLLIDNSPPDFIVGSPDEEDSDWESLLKKNVYPKIKKINANF